MWDLKQVVLDQCLWEKRSSLDLCHVFTWEEFFFVIHLALHVSGQLPYFSWDSLPSVEDILAILGCPKS